MVKNTVISFEILSFSNGKVSFTIFLLVHIMI